jgi:hypothetical protein
VTFNDFNDGRFRLRDLGADVAAYLICSNN